MGLNGRKLWDFRCDVCGEVFDDFWKEGDDLPEHCDQPAVRIPGGVYKENYTDMMRRTRPAGSLNGWKADPITRNDVLKGLKRRERRLAGTGML